MGFGSSLKKAAKKVGKQIKSGASKTYKEYDRYTSSKFGAYFTPYLSMYDSDGRDALSKAWGGWATAGASAVNPAAGAVVGTAVTAYNNRNVSDQRASPAFGPSAPPPSVPETPAQVGGVSWWMVGGAVGVVVVAVVLAVALKKRGSK